MNIRNVHKDVCIIRISNPCVHLSSFPCTSNWKWTYSSHKLQLIKNCILMAGIFFSMQSCPNKLCTFHEWFDVLHLNSVFTNPFENHRASSNAIVCDYFCDQREFKVIWNQMWYNYKLSLVTKIVAVLEKHFIGLDQNLICSRCFVLKQSKLLI